MFAVDSLAKTSVRQASKPASKKALALACSTNSCESFAWWDRDTSSWRTSQRSLLTEWTLYLERWPKQGLMLNGHVFRRQMWAPAIGVIGGGVLPTPVAQTGAGGPKGLDGGSGARQMLADAGFPRAAGAPSLLPTPTASDAIRGNTPETQRAHMERKGRTGSQMHWPLSVMAQELLPTPRTCSAMASRLDTPGNLEGERFPNLETVVAREMLPTPRANDAEKRGNFDPTNPRNGLPAVVKLLPTHTTNDSKNASLPPSQAERDGLAGAMLRNDSIPTGAATYLNPSFVEEMMGFPVGWTA